MCCGLMLVICHLGHSISLCFSCSASQVYSLLFDGESLGFHVTLYIDMSRHSYLRARCCSFSMFVFLIRFFALFYLSVLFSPRSHSLLPSCSLIQVSSMSPLFIPAGPILGPLCMLARVVSMGFFQGLCSRPLVLYRTCYSTICAK